MRSAARAASDGTARVPDSSPGGVASPRTRKGIQSHAGSPKALQAVLWDRVASPPMAASMPETEPPRAIDGSTGRCRSEPAGALRPRFRRRAGNALVRFARPGPPPGGRAFASTPRPAPRSRSGPRPKASSYRLCNPTGAGGGSGRIHRSPMRIRPGRLPPRKCRIDGPPSSPRAPPRECGAQGSRCKRLPSATCHRVGDGGGRRPPSGSRRGRENRSPRGRSRTAAGLTESRIEERPSGPLRTESHLRRPASNRLDRSARARPGRQRASVLGGRTDPIARASPVPTQHYPSYHRPISAITGGNSYKSGPWRKVNRPVRHNYSRKPLRRNSRWIKV